MIRRMRTRGLASVECEPRPAASPSAPARSPRADAHTASVEGSRGLIVQMHKDRVGSRTGTPNQASRARRRRGGTLCRRRHGVGVSARTVMTAVVAYRQRQSPAGVHSWEMDDMKRARCGPVWSTSWRAELGPSDSDQRSATSARASPPDCPSCGRVEALPSGSLSALGAGRRMTFRQRKTKSATRTDPSSSEIRSW